MKWQTFLKRMQTYLNEEDFALFQASYEQEPYKGIRVNPLRPFSLDTLQSNEFSLKQTPFSSDHFYVTSNLSGNHPFHLAGLYYMQEPSAGSAVEALNVQPGDFVLDLCAAPGGKSTQIAGKLQQQGLILSNEIVTSRAQILLSNFERMGVQNGIITNMRPDMLATQLPHQFDKVLVDAPCSGEGMFRKDQKAVEEWSLEHVNSCAARQLPILEAAYQTLKAGGTLVYSTCTFSYEENEEIVSLFLAAHTDMELIDVGVEFGRSGIGTTGIDVSKVRRIYPMDGGEGHFVAKMTKKNEPDKETEKLLHRPTFCKEKNLSTLLNFLNDQLFEFDQSRIMIHKDMAYYLPEWIPNLSSLKLIRAGICIGEINNNLVRPHHHFYLAFPAKQYRKAISLKLNDSRLSAYLRGMEIMDESEIEGYCSIQIDGYALGFGKKSKQCIKNHYPKGLRLH